MNLDQSLESIDRIYQSDKGRKPFVFDAEVARVFDDMVRRSVPFYGEIHKLICDLLRRKLPQDGLIYDLGCSTGETILTVWKSLSERAPHFVGVDNSIAMIEQCRQKLEEHQVTNVTLSCKGVDDVVFENPDVIIMNYTLQFVPTHKRLMLLKNIHQGLKKGGIFILSEKIESSNAEIEELQTELYYDFKRRNGYSELEIAQKREALEKVLVPMTPEAQLNLLREAGFRNVDLLFRWYNFVSYVGIK